MDIVMADSPADVTVAYSVVESGCPDSGDAAHPASMNRNAAADSIFTDGYVIRFMERRIARQFDRLLLCI